MTITATADQLTAVLQPPPPGADAADAADAATTTDRRARRKARLATAAADAAKLVAASTPTPEVVSLRFAVLARPENVALIKSCARHAATQRAAGNSDAYDIAQSLTLALATAKASTPPSTAVILLGLSDGNKARGGAYAIVAGMARNYARHDADAAARERSSGLLTMGVFNATHHESYAAALASDGDATQSDKDDAARRISGADHYAAAMGSASAVARPDDHKARMKHYRPTRKVREQTIGGNEYDAKGVVRLIKEKSLESMLEQQMSVGGMLIGGVHGGGNGDAADSLAMRRFQETFYAAPTPHIDGDAATSIRHGIMRMHDPAVRAAAVLFSTLAPAADTSQWSAMQAIASGQVDSFGRLIAACVSSTKPRKRGRGGKGTTHVAAVTPTQAIADPEATELDASTVETSRVEWTLLLSLCGIKATPHRVATVKAMAQTVARDSGALYDASRSTIGAVTADRIASVTTRGGMTPVVKQDSLRSWRGEQTVLRSDAAPASLRIARHADAPSSKSTPFDSAKEDAAARGLVEVAPIRWDLVKPHKSTSRRSITVDVLATAPVEATTTAAADDHAAKAPRCHCVSCR